jgi:microcystin-dependent protein
MHWGHGPGLTDRFIGETGGESSVTLLSSEMPSHNHLMQSNEAAGDTASPGNATFGTSGGRGRPSFYAAQGTNVPMAPQAIGLTGGGQAHNNMQPYLAVNFIIALQGVFPPRN